VTARAVGETLLRDRAELANTQVSLAFARQPRLQGHDGTAERTGSLQDVNLQLSCLAAALFADRPALFIDHVAWSKVTLTQRGWAVDDLAANYHCLCDALRFELPTQSADVAVGFVRQAIEHLPSMPTDIPTFIRPRHPHALLARLFLKALLRADLRAARGLIVGAIEEGIGTRHIYLNVLQPALYEVGRLWQLNQISVAREHFCTAAAQSILAIVNRNSSPRHHDAAPTIVSTCVSGEQHELGIRMVSDFFDMAGWNSCYLGANTPNEGVVGEVIERNADVLAVSMTMAHQYPQLEDLVQSVRRAPQCGNVKILVGGYPFQRAPDLWSLLGADGAASDAEEAVEVVTSLFDTTGAAM
jgi:methanogenic corrinoid protein MtbC1